MLSKDKSCINLSLVRYFHLPVPTECHNIPNLAQANRPITSLAPPFPKLNLSKLPLAASQLFPLYRMC